MFLDRYIDQVKLTLIHTSQFQGSTLVEVKHLRSIGDLDIIEMDFYELKAISSLDIGEYMQRSRIPRELHDKLSLPSIN